ncbi:MAG: 3-deoxy-D-manno-octulosonic acid transferase [Ignavibacteriales bacterium]|nr:3-deoxy-D-manno-octulosonic acid transferase [Ignavibacteriales bacterium]
MTRAFWTGFYNTVAIPLFWLLLQVGSLVNSKIRRGIRGRIRLFDRLEQEVPHLKHRRRIWFHSSSLGEFEQAKPIIAAIRKKFKNIDIVVTFFSPSGYEHSRNYPLADLITYIPLDTAANARRFLNLIQPDAAVMVRYDVWPNHVWELDRLEIPAFIANATLRRNSARLRWPFNSFHHHVYQSLSSILTVSESDAESFRRFRLTRPQIHVVGETRYDQVWQRREEAKRKHLLPPALLRGKKVFVVGSSWEEDEDVILESFRNVYRFDQSVLMILVPHEPTLETLERLEVQLTYLGLRTIRFSDLNDFSHEHVIIVDSVGILMTLYQYADVAYVGGSFKQGIHNVLEPAVYGLPVMFGPKCANSQEAQELASLGGGFIIRDREEASSVLMKLFSDDRNRKRAGKTSLNLVKRNTGATKRFLEYLYPILERATSR